MSHTVTNWCAFLSLVGVVYADENQMDIHLTANAENYDIAQLLAALDSDEGDEILWALVPRQSTVH